MTLNPIRENMTELELSEKIVGGLPIKVLFSYRTPVAMSDSAGLCFITEKKWSNTTSRHINEWLQGRPARKEKQEFFDGLVK